MWLSLADSCIPGLTGRDEFIPLLRRLQKLYIYIGEMKDRPEFSK